MADIYFDLCYYAHKGDLFIVKKMIDRGDDINAQLPSGTTPLHSALAGRKFECFKYLLDRGANPEVKNIYGYTPLHNACIFNLLDYVMLLIEHGADVNSKSDVGTTPLHEAVKEKHSEIIKLLLKNKANPKITNRHNQNLFDIFNEKSCF